MRKIHHGMRKWNKSLEELLDFIGAVVEPETAMALTCTMWNNNIDPEEFELISSDQIEEMEEELREIEDNSPY